MSRKKRWEESKIIDGIATIKFSSWKYFSPFIHDEMLSFPHYIWRGQADSSWLLEPTLDRELKKLNKLNNRSVNYHLNNFKYSVRGRRGRNPSELKNEDDWWALGQHYGLATPLLDWTYSPFVAAFFAFQDENVESEYRAIYSLHLDTLLSNKELKNKIKSIKPMTDENSRLVNQNGEFTRTELGLDIENLVKIAAKGNEKEFTLMKLLIPSKDRDICLAYLNKMNINHLTLFPDVNGSAKHCNQQLKSAQYY